MSTNTVRRVESFGNCRISGLDLNTLPAASLVAKGVGFTSGKVLDIESCYGHGEWSFFVVGHPASPLDCAVGIASRVTTGPDTEPDAHGSLWKVLAIQCHRIVVVECANDVVVDVPIDFLGGPDGGVIVECESVVDWVPDGAVVRSGISLAYRLSVFYKIVGSRSLTEKVGLHKGCVSTDHFPINFVKIV